MPNGLLVGMAGSGGDGVVSAGEALLGAAASSGFHAMMTKSFGSQIRGGESSCRVRLSDEPVSNPGGALDVAVALNWEDFLKFGSELPLAESTVLIYEAKAGPAPEALAKRAGAPRELVAAPISELAKSAAGTERAKTSVVLGLISGWFGLGRDAFARGLEKKFGAHPPAPAAGAPAAAAGAGASAGEATASSSTPLLEANLRALDAGIAFALGHPLESRHALPRPPGEPGSKMLCDGNELCAAGAIFAGCEFFSGYPITPSTEVMQVLSEELWKYGGTVLQCEDEIAGIGAAVGASFAGKKAMTASSGPGMSLKTEILGLASLAELPLVVYAVQRGGPSTGLPTKPEQADLFQAAFSAHGDVLRPVLAPTTVADTFSVTVEAFNIAEEFQTPVLVLSDQEIAQRKETVDRIDTSSLKLSARRRPTEAELGDYQRFRLTADGISPISHPGLERGNYLCAGIEHNERGDPTSSGAMHTKMNEKRFKKLAPLKAQRRLFRTYGKPAAPLALVSWGGSAGVCLEAFGLAEAEGLPVKLLVPTLLYPIAEGLYTEFFASVQRGLVVELSHQGQLYRILRMFVDVPKGVVSLCRSGANPFTPAEVLARLRGLAAELPERRAGAEVSR